MMPCRSESPVALLSVTGLAAAAEDPTTSPPAPTPSSAPAPSPPPPDKMIVRSRLPVSRPVALAIFGMIVGLTATLGISSFSSLPARCVSERRAHDSNGLVLIGIMTAAKYVDTRAYNVWKTWAQHIPGKVLFFVAEGTESIHPDLPLVRLKGVDDTYPPQKKSFAMVRWMYDNHIDNFDWFLRADDDLYVRGGELEKFLRSLDPLKAHQIGQAGFGNSAEYGLLGLGNRDNYCMGGPGVVMSKHTLRKVAPHLEGCVGHLLTTHEDVELGRCIQKHAGVACTWNYEMQKLFHNNQTVAKAYMDNDDELKAAITLHPIKDPAMMRRLHWRNRALELKKLRSQREQLRTELSTARPSGLIWRQPNKTQHLTPWDFINNNKILFCADRVNCPRHTVDASIRREMNEIIEQLFDEFNENARVRGRVLQFQSLQYGYMRVEPQHGVHYVMDMILWFKKFRPPHRATLSVRRHAYVQQTFGPVKAIGDPAYRRKQQLSNGSNRTEHTHLYMVMALRGRAEIFARFAGHLKNVCGGNADTTLVLVLYDSDDVASIRATASDLAATSSVRVNIINMGSEKFSRGVALMKGASTLSKDALIFMTDVDMLFTCDTLQRIRLNTILNAQVYFPIVFSEFSPESWSENDRLLADAFHYGRRRGYFRHFGYGLASMYRADLDSVGGFDTNIKGWGMEDVDLFEKVVRSKLRVLRAPEPGLVHIYHPIHCAADLPPAQKSMCRGSKAASLSSIDALYDQIAHYT